MNIALLGYGKMGIEIEKICLDRKYEIVARIDHEDDWTKYKHKVNQADVAIEFSTPDSVLHNIRQCFKHNIPIVVGTTAWEKHHDELKSLCLKEDQSLIYGSNFSVGVNIFFHINELLAKQMNQYSEYNVSMEEIHHTQKLDAPSGTAISIADIIIQDIDRLDSWKKDESQDPTILGISSKRIDPTPGTHSITYDSGIDEIQLVHTAKNRQGFAKGAVYAAEWIIGKNGWYNFKDILF